jgi:hypothetical protein
MATITTKDGTEIYYKDWGTGQSVVFSHGWPLSADAFEDQMFFLAGHGYRCIAHDRRGHGRSSQPWAGNDMDTYADDLAELVKALDLKDAVHVGQTLTFTAATPQEGAECKNINYDPLVMSDGIAPTDDPVLLFRSPSYAVSFVKRLQGK